MHVRAQIIFKVKFLCYNMNFEETCTFKNKIIFYVWLHIKRNK